MPFWYGQQGLTSQSQRNGTHDYMGRIIIVIVNA
jgi:hypothetical protein